MRILAAIVVTVGLAAVAGVGLGWLSSWGNQLWDQGILRFLVVAFFSNLATALAAYFVVRSGGALSGTTGTAAGGATAVALSVVAFLSMMAVASRLPRAEGTTGVGIGAHLFTWGLGLGFVQVFRDLRDGTWFGETETEARDAASRAPGTTSAPPASRQTIPTAPPGEGPVPELFGESTGTKKRPYLVCHDYGMGGVWAIVDARSAQEITRKYRALSVVEERPDWIDDDELQRIAETDRYDIDAPSSGWLAELARNRPGS